MIVVLIIGILLAMAVPQWVATRSRTQQRTCMSQLKAIGSAKEQFAMETGKSNGDAVVAGDLAPTYMKGATIPSCPGGGAYTIGVVGTDPSCSLSGAPVFPHLSP